MKNGTDMSEGTQQILNLLCPFGHELIMKAIFIIM